MLARFVISADAVGSDGLEEANRLGLLLPHFLVLFVRASAIGGRASLVLGWSYEVVFDHISFDFFAAHVSEHNSIYFDAR